MLVVVARFSLLLLGILFFFHCNFALVLQKGQLGAHNSVVLKDRKIKLVKVQIF